MSIDNISYTWDKRLIVMEREKKLNAKELLIENDINKYEQLALKYLNPEYTYEPK